MTQYGFFFDQTRCYGCQACATACKDWNDLEPGPEKWMCVYEWETGAFPSMRIHELAFSCGHCENPACVSVCPTGASYQADDGTVQIDQDKCIGCKYCMAACPYGVRVQIEKTGVIEKCRFCWYEGQPGNPPRCVNTCVSGARIFGDLDDPKSEICQEIARTNAQPLASDLTAAKIYYVR